MFNLFPFTNFHDLNMDWIIKSIKSIKTLVSKAVFSVNNTIPDANGNVNLPTVAGVSSVNGIGADGYGNVQLNANNVGAISSVEQVGYLTPNQYLTVLQGINSYIEKGNSIAEIFFAGKATTQFPANFELVTSAPHPRTWFNFIGVKNDSSSISLKLLEDGSIVSNEAISVDDTIYFHEVYMK